MQSGQNQQFESRRSNVRSRTKTVVKETPPEKPLSRGSAIRGRTRQSVRKYPSTVTLPIDQTYSSSNTVSTTLSSRSVDSKSDINKTNEVELASETTLPNQFRRRSSTVSTIEEIKPIKSRRRINSRTNSSALDLEVAGTTNTFTAATKEQIVSRVNDGRHSRKLRYRTRTSETETNLSGEGINKVRKTSEINDVASQPEFKGTTSLAPENTFQSSTESISTSSTLKSIKVVRRPITRTNSNFKSSDVNNKSKMSDEISEDDNYPESFKVLIQAKNAVSS